MQESAQAALSYIRSRQELLGLEEGFYAENDFHIHFPEFVPKDGRVIGKEGEFDRAWFRLSNEETNQTLDYCMLKKVELPEDYQELIPNEDDEEAPPFRNTLTYIAGALFLDASRGTP